MTDEQINLTVDGQTVTVNKGDTVYKAVKKLGIDLPIFCYQDRMEPFGACRVCLVEVDKMGKLQTSCTLAATEGMVVKTQSQLAVEGRKGILELLLINHPLDCPICDRAGECPLQENALKFGPGESRFVEEKRHFKKPIALGPVLMLDRERCIQCARCTRFSEHISGDFALQLIDRGYRLEVGTPDQGPAKSKFIGNTIMICPVGALTSRVYRFQARPWDNQSVKTTCTLCPVGCSMMIDSRDGAIMRTRVHEDSDVNDIWLCDKGWFGYEFSENAERLTTPLIRRNGSLEPATWDEALTLAARKLTEYPAHKIAAIGGNPLTIEENYLFQKLMKEIIGTPYVDHRIGMSDSDQNGMEISLAECEKVNSALILGSDLTEEYPILWLRLHQAINKGAKISFAGYYLPEIATLLAKAALTIPGKEIELLDELLKDKPEAIFIGRQYLNSPAKQQILAKLKSYKEEHSQSTINFLEAKGNSLGASFAGMLPMDGRTIYDALETASKEGWGTLYAAGFNLAAKLPSQFWSNIREKLQFLIVQDLFLTETAQQADLVLPTLSFYEKEGTFMNIEGRLRTLQPGKEIPHHLMSDGEIFQRVAAALNKPLDYEQSFKSCLLLPRIKKEFKVDQTPPLPSSDLVAIFAPQLFDRGVRMQHNPHLIQLVKTPKLRMHPAEAEKRGIIHNTSITIQSSSGALTAHVLLDKKVAERTIVIPLGFPDLPAHELGIQLKNGMPIEIIREEDV